MNRYEKDIKMFLTSRLLEIRRLEIRCLDIRIFT